jgi:hypothetical protein
MLQPEPMRGDAVFLDFATFHQLEVIGNDIKKSRLRLIFFGFWTECDYGHAEIMVNHKVGDLARRLSTRWQAIPF